MEEKEKYLQLLNKRVEKLTEEEFDFEAWKTGTIVLLARIFGPQDYRIKKLEDLKIDYGSSWSMRAVSGSFNPLESARNQSREIVYAAIDEIQTLGLKVVDIRLNNMELAFGDLFTTNELAKMKEWVNQGKPSKKEWNALMKKFKQQQLVDLVFQIYFG